MRVTAAHHPLAGQTLTVVRRTRYAGEPQLVVERADGGRQLLPMRCVAPESAERAPILIVAPQEALSCSNLAFV